MPTEWLVLGTGLVLTLEMKEWPSALVIKCDV